MTDRTAAEQLAQGVDKLDLQVTPDETQQKQLLEYLYLLERWNRKTNLTAIKSIDEMIDRHILDSLTVLPYVEGSTLIDVGSGAGLPGIPLAISNPDLSVLMLDSASKKTRFIQQAIAELGLSNARVEHTRVEDAVSLSADTVVARAFATPVKIIESCRHLCTNGGIFLLLMADPGNKLDELPPGSTLEQLVPVTIPGSEAIRNIAVCRFHSGQVAKSD